MASQKQTFAKASEQAARSIKRLIFAAMILVGGITILMWSLESIDEKKQIAQKTISGNPCPAYPPRMETITTPGENRWSQMVYIPEQCGVRWYFATERDRDITHVKTAPDNKPYTPEELKKSGVLRPVLGVSFKSNKPINIAIELYPR